MTDARTWLDQVDARAKEDAPPTYKVADDALIATTALRAVLDLHQEGDDGECTGCRAECLYCESEHDYPCPTVTAITTALEEA